VRSLVVLVLLCGHAVASPRIETRGDACDLTRMKIESPSDAHVLVETSVAGSATVTFDNGRQRVVSEPSCAELADAVALVIEVALADDRPPVPAGVASVAPAAAVAIAPASAPTEMAISATGVTGVSSHGWEQAVIAGARWRRDDVSLGTELRASAPDHEALTASAELAVWSAAASVVPCVHRSSFAGCATITAGFIWGSGSGLTDEQRATTPLLAGGLRLVWEHALTDRLALRLQLDAETALTTSRFDINQMAVWTSDRLALWGGAGVSAHFP
jgi:hypothetical protein